MSIMWPLCLAGLCGRARSVYSAPPRNAGNCLHCLLQPLASSVLLFLDARAHKLPASYFMLHPVKSTVVLVLWLQPVPLYGV